MDWTSILASVGGAAGLLALLWHVFTLVAAKTSNTIDDRIVSSLQTIVFPIVKALVDNTEATKVNSSTTATNTGATDTNTAVIDPNKTLGA